MRATVLALFISAVTIPAWSFSSIASLTSETQAVQVINGNICATDKANGFGCVDGTVVDENGQAVKYLEVELIPSFKAGDAQWSSTKRVWTNEHGEYQFNRVEAGEYVLAVHHEAAPDERFPFASAYYPGVEQESDAGHVRVFTSSETALAPLRLRRLKLVTITVEILWSDGTKHVRSNLLVHNASYPHQAVIGDEAPQVDNGRGQFTLPTGFDYIAAAKVDCDAGKVIESRESNRVQIKVSDDFGPSELILTLPGQPCVLWAAPTN